MTSKHKKIKNLFLRQSYLDSWEDYQRSIRKSNFIKWDYIILTASNEDQASSFRRQIDRRLELGQLPAATKYAVLSDPDGKRVGSGGATFNVLRYLAEQHPDEEHVFQKNVFLSFIPVVTASVCRSILLRANCFHRYRMSCRMDGRPLCLMNL